MEQLYIQSPAANAAPLCRAMPLFEEAAMELIFLFELRLQNLFALSAVCRQWRDIVCKPVCWINKLIDVSTTSLVREPLEKWLIRWRPAKCVHLSFHQTDLLAAPPTMPHAIAHLWDSDALCQSNHFWPWHHVSINAKPWLVCLTADRVPDSVRVLQCRSQGCVRNFDRPVWLGWTSATAAEDFSAMTVRIGEGRSRHSDIAIGVSLWPRDAWGRIVITSMLRGRRLPRNPPQCFNEEAPRMADLQLDRARRTMRIQPSGDNERLRFSVRHQPIVGTLRFFIAMPVGQGSGRRGAATRPRPCLSPSMSHDAGPVVFFENA